MSYVLKVTRHLARALSLEGLPTARRSRATVQGKPRILIIGIYIANKPNYASQLVREFGKPSLVAVSQRWVGLRGEPVDAAVMKVTKFLSKEDRPKWQLVNELVSLDDLLNFDYIAVSDDDIRVPEQFVDKFLAEQQAFDFALAQPARTWASFTDHEIVRRRLWVTARRTDFVESGPFVCFRTDLLRLVYPFSLESPMGWGYDLTWPIVARGNGLKLGIIDGVPLDHSLRPRGALYDEAKQLQQMAKYLSTRAHVQPFEMKRAIQTYR